MNTCSDDILKIIFSSLQSTLLIDSTNDSKLSRNYKDVLSRVLAADIFESSVNRLSKIRKLQSIVHGYMNCALQNSNAVIESISDTRARSYLQCMQRQLAFERRLFQQQRISERRLRELLFEITGEYGKSILRIERRAEFLRISGRIRITNLIWKLRWEKFVHRICYEVNKSRETMNSLECQLSGYILCPRQDAEEIKFVAEALKRLSKLEISPALKITAVIRFQRGPSPNRGSTTSNVKRTLVTSRLSELEGMVVELRNWASPQRLLRSSGGARPHHSLSPVDRMRISGNSKAARTAAGDSSERNHKLSLAQIVSARSIAWLHPSSFCPSYWDELVKHRISNRMKVDPSQAGSTPHISPRASTGDGFDEFAERYASQHSSFVCSDRLYFCLEERAAAMELYWNRDDGAAGESTAPRGEVDGLDDPCMALQRCLQVSYSRQSFHAESCI